MMKKVVSFLLVAAFLLAPIWAAKGNRYREYSVWLAVYVGGKVQITAEDILCRLKIESGLFRNVGQPMAGLSDVNVNRDAACFWYVASIFGYDPYTALASKAQSFGFGGAIGGAQLLVSTYCDLSGLTVRPKYRLFSDCHKKYKGNDLKVVQHKLNQYFGPVLKVDGKDGKRTRWYLREYFRRVPATVDLSRYAGDPGFVKSFFTLQAGYTVSYNPGEDRIALALGRPGPLNPWDPVVSVTGMAILLKDLGVMKNRHYAHAAYFTGPGGAKSARGKKHARDTLAAWSWARKEVRAYYKKNGWKFR